VRGVASETTHLVVHFAGSMELVHTSAAMRAFTNDTDRMYRAGKGEGRVSALPILTFESTEWYLQSRQSLFLLHTLMGDLSFLSSRPQ
jgi:hypothetical protein